jgi:hypothetical protein
MRGFKEILRSRLGNFVPLECSDLAYNRSATADGFSYTVIAPDDEKTKAETRAYMTKNFYSKAVVPAALNLSSDAKGGNSPNSTKVLSNVSRPVSKSRV